VRGRRSEVWDIVERGADRMLKIVAGKIISHAVRGSGGKEGIHERLKVFCGNGNPGCLKDFPVEPMNEWDGNFARFATRLEEDFEDPDTW
jgi:hypothetical protein